MRDKKRIKLFLNEFESLWERVPDYRFWQVINIIGEYIPQRDPFFLEEDEWLEAIRKCKDNIRKYDFY